MTYVEYYLWPCSGSTDLLGQEGLGDHLHVHEEEFVEHLMDKVAQIYLQLETMPGAGPLEMPNKRS